MLGQTRGLRGFHPESPAQERRRISCLRHSPRPRPSPRAKAPAHPAAQRGRLAEWGSLPLLSGSPQTPPSSPPHYPLLGGIPLLPSAHLDPGEGRVLCPNLQNHHSSRAHLVTPGPKPCPRPTSPRTPTPTAGEPGARLGSLSSPAGQPPASPSRGTSSPPLPPRSCPRGWSPSSWRHLQGQGDAGGALCLVTDTEGTREGRELRFGARRTPGRPPVAQGGFMLARRPPTPTHIHTQTHSLTHTGRS